MRSARTGRIGMVVMLSLTVPAQVPHAVGDGEVAARIDALFARWTSPGSPGASVGVVEAGKLVFARGYGLARIEDELPLTPATPFHVASESKQFTAVAILLLAERGRLSLDDDVRKHLPEVPDFGTPITIRHLLNHTSGLRDQWQALALAGRGSQDVITTAHVLRFVSRQRALNFAPGATELYCNTGYTLLAEIAARVGGGSFREFTRRELFGPLGMANTGFRDRVGEELPGAAWSYVAAPGGTGFVRRQLTYAVPGATCLWTTVEDLARWLANFDTPRVGSAALFERLVARDRLADGTEVVWGRGTTTGVHRGFTTHGHGGGDAGYRAYMVRFPQLRLGVAVLANVAAVNPGPFGDDALALQVADLFLPPTAAADERTVAPPAPPRLDAAAHVGTYRASDGEVVNVVDEYGVLQLWEPRTGDQHALRQLPDGAFAVGDGANDRVRFASRDGVPTGVTITRGERTWSGERGAVLPADGFASYVGRFYSEELEATWTLVATSDGLRARHVMHDDVALTPVVRDLFRGDAWFLGELRVLRAPDGAVSGLSISAGRIKRVQFRRLPP